MTDGKTFKAAARALARAQGISYTAARRAILAELAAPAAAGNAASATAPAAAPARGQTSAARPEWMRELVTRTARVMLERAGSARRVVGGSGGASAARVHVAHAEALGRLLESAPRGELWDLLDGLMSSWEDDLSVIDADTDEVRAWEAAAHIADIATLRGVLRAIDEDGPDCRDSAGDGGRLREVGGLCGAVAEVAGRLRERAARAHRVGGPGGDGAGRVHADHAETLEMLTADPTGTLRDELTGVLDYWAWQLSLKAGDTSDVETGKAAAYAADIAALREVLATGDSGGDGGGDGGGLAAVRRV